MINNEKKNWPTTKENPITLIQSNSIVLASDQRKSTKLTNLKSKKKKKKAHQLTNVIIH